MELEDDLSVEANKRIYYENELNDVRTMISRRQPFFVKSTTFNFDNGYLSFDYYGTTDAYVKVSVRAYGTDGDSYNNSSSIYISSGNHSARIFLSRYLNSSKWYSFEILRENVIMGGDRH